MQENRMSASPSNSFKIRPEISLLTMEFLICIARDTSANSNGQINIVALRFR